MEGASLVKRSALAASIALSLLAAGAIGYGVAGWDSGGDSPVLVVDADLPALPEYRWYYVAEGDADGVREEYGPAYPPCSVFAGSEHARAANEYSQPFFVETGGFQSERSRIEPEPLGYWVFPVQCDSAR